FLTSSLALICLITPFPRKYHHLGLFRERTPTKDHFKNIITQTKRPVENQKVLYFKDGPNTTVTVLGYLNEEDVVSGKSILVNGKSDGHTIGDYSTTTLLPLIPYLATPGDNLKTMVIGIGTGISAGVFSSVKRISQVDVVDISPALINSVPTMAPENLHFYKNPKTTIHENDAFQFLKTVDDKYNIIISAPSNPWFVGIENLYTKYFYNLAKNNMTPDGVFAQWMQIYSFSREIITTVLANLKGVFKNITVFQTSAGDLAFLASNRSIPLKTSINEVSSIEDLSMDPTVKKIFSNLGIQKITDLNLYTLYNSEEVDAIIETNYSFTHEILFPTLNREAYFSFFNGKSVNPAELLNPAYKRILIDKGKIDLAQKKRLKDLMDGSNCEKKSKYTDFSCVFLKRRYQLKNAFKNLDGPSVKKRIIAYSTLRGLGLIEKDLSFVHRALQNMPPLSAKTSTLSIAQLIIGELVAEQDYPLAKTVIDKLMTAKFINAKRYKVMLEYLESMKIKQQKFQKSLNR
ncbi:MAG: hypothetical protein OXB84_06640, partial [Halobacteriovoraceae bacterium]|nr:hypothetical protein [Halobacteriovoraceae bacterium]